MNWFKRLCMFVFGLSGLLSLVALSLVWVGPWTTQARTLITENLYYFWALEAMVCIAAVGLLGCVLTSLFAPRNPKETIVAEVAGGKITVTRTAIAKQARHIVEADGTCVPVSVRVHARPRGRIKVFVRVKPHLPLDVVERGEILYAELGEGLAKVCGDSVQKISIVFTDPEQQGTLSTYVDTDNKADQGAEKDEAVSETQTPTVKSTISTRDIIVDMSSASAPKGNAPESPAPEPEPVSEPEPEPEPTAALEPELETTAELAAAEPEPAIEPDSALATESEPDANKQDSSAEEV